MIRRRRPLLFVAAGALLAAGALGGCVRGGVSLAQATDTVERSLAIEAGTTVRVETFNGSVDVRANPGATEVRATIERTGAGATRAEAEEDRENVQVTLEPAGGTALLRAVYAPSPDSVSDRGASVTLTVPAGTPVEIETTNGAVTVRDTGAAVGVRTSNGRVGVAGVTGAVIVETSNGEVTVEATAATADIRTSNAELRFSGSLAEGSHDLRTSNGRLELRLPGVSSFTIDASTSNARMTTDFAIAGEIDDDAIQGTAGDPAAAASTRITAETSNAELALLAG